MDRPERSRDTVAAECSASIVRPGGPLCECVQGEGKSSSTIKVMLANRDSLIRGALSALLNREADLTVVAEACHGHSVLDVALTHRPDVAVIDLVIPSLDGLKITMEMTQLLPGCAVIVLAGRAELPHLRQTLLAGAKGFLAKSAPADSLAEVVRWVHVGGRYVDPRLAADVITAPECPLARRELEVLRLVEGGATVAEIAKRVQLSSGTVRNYLASVVNKLGASNRLEALHIAYDNGWI